MNILAETTWPEKLSGPQTEYKPELSNLKAVRRKRNQPSDTIIQRKNSVVTWEQKEYYMCLKWSE